MGVRTQAGKGEIYAGWQGPPTSLAVTVGIAVVVLLWLNGRPLPEGPATGALLGGKAVASLLAGVAAGLLFAAAGRRYPSHEAVTAAFALVFGTSFWAASQSRPTVLAAGMAVAAAVYGLVRAEDDETWSERAAFCLPLAAAFDPPAVAFALVVLVAIFLRWPWRSLWLGAHFAAGLLVALVARAVLSGGALLPETPSLGLAGPGVSPLAFFFSPARGVLAFSPIAIVAGFGGVRALARLPRHLAATLGGGFLAQALLLALVGDVETGRTWGTLLLTSAWPALLYFLPEGLAGFRLLGVLIVAASVAVQAVGAFTYDQRWDRLHRTSADRIPEAVLWDPARSPVALALQERVLRLAAPSRRDGRWVVNTYPLVPGSPRGSIVEFGGGVPAVAGSELVLGHVFLEGGARVDGKSLRLEAAGDGLFFRVSEEARARRLEVRVRGRGRGRIVIGERTFWTEPRWTVHPVDGPFRLRKPYYFPESGGPDVRVALSANGAVEITRVSLVVPNEPEDVIRTP
jgi:hypothetical protein